MPPRLTQFERQRRIDLKRLGFVQIKGTSRFRAPKRVTQKFKAFLDNVKRETAKLSVRKLLVKKTIIRTSTRDDPLNPVELLSQMKPTARYYIEINTVNTHSRATLTRVTSPHQRFFNHVFTRQDAGSVWTTNYVQHMDNFLMIQLSYPKVEYKLIPMPPQPQLQGLQVQNLKDTNCLFAIIAQVYPRMAEWASQTGQRLREQQTETVAELSREIKTKPLHITLKGFNNEVLDTLKGKGYGTRNLNIYIHNGHAFKENLQFAQINEVITTTQLEECLSEEVNQCIKIYRNDGGYLRAYRTHDGRVMISEHFQEAQLEVAERYRLTDYNPLLTPFALKFKVWVDANGWKPTAYYKDEIKQATMECILWNDFDVQRGTRYDRNNSFVSVTNPNNDAYPWYLFYGIPQHCHHYLHNPTINFALSVSGIVHCSFTVQSKHPAILQQFNHHESDLYTTPFIKYCYENKIISDLKIYKVMYASQKKLIDWVGFDPYQGREFIGKCHQNGGYTEYYIDNDEYRNYHFHQHRERGIHCQIDNKYKTLSIPQKPTSQYLEIRTFVMSYQMIAMFEIIRKYDSSLLRVGVDDVLVKPKTKWEEPTWDGTNYEDKIMGQWKVESKSCNFLSSATLKETRDVTVYDDPDPIFELPDNEIFLKATTSPVSNQQGKAGWGKSYLFYEVCSKMNPKAYTILTPTKALAKKKKKLYKKKGCDLSIVNWQQFFGTTFADPKWLESPHTKAGMSNSFIVWDEIYTVDASTIQFFVGWLRERNSTVILIGDPKQLEPFDGIDNVVVVDSLSDHRLPDPLKDWRSLDQATSDCKDSLRDLIEEDAIKVLADTIGYTQWEEFLRKWTPQSLVYASTHNMNQYIAPILEGLHDRNFPNEAKPYLFAKSKKWCEDCESSTCEHAEIYHNGELIYSHRKPEGAELAYTTTIHKSIGDTVEDNVFIIADRNSSAFCNHGLYTAVTRIQKMSQLHFVSVPEKLRMKAHLYSSSSQPIEVQIERRIRLHRLADEPKKRETNITIDYVKKLISTAKRCLHCDQDLLYNNYCCLDSNIWSINRLDNKVGHVVGNVEICCRSCNFHKRH